MNHAFNRRQLLQRFALGTILPLTLHACSRPLKPYKAQILVFGTQVDLTLYHPDQSVINQAVAQINQDFQQFHHEWHAWEKGGIISKINQAIAAGESIELADSVKSFIEKSQALSAQSDALFDPGIGKLIAMWGFHGDHWQGPPPKKTQIVEWLQQRPSIKDIYFIANRLFCRNPAVQLDFGGNAKGLALDIAMQSLQSAHIQHALVSIGGDMKALGNKPQNTPWQVAIQNPQNPQNALAALSLHSGESVVTSGTYQRFYQWQGQRYSHILNPNTGYPANGFASVTVIHPDATTADSAATALLIAGPQQWQKIAAQMAVDTVFCVTHSGEFAQTKAMEKRLKLI